MKNTTYAFIDASNLFYGGEKSLGWKIDYKKLMGYLKTKYGITRVLYFGGVEIHSFPYSYLENDNVPLKPLEKHLEKYIRDEGKKLDEAKLLLLSKHLQRVRFYIKLEGFGYKLFLKPVKLYYQSDGTTQRKANCDVEMAARGERTAREIRQFAGDKFRDFMRLERELRYEGK